jgi:hypothetical protein
MDSRGQHKDRKSENRLQEKTAELIEVQAKKENDSTLQSRALEIEQYNNSKVDISNYL